MQTNKPIEINRSIKYSSTFWNGLHRPKYECFDIDFGWVEGRSNGHFVAVVHSLWMGIKQQQSSACTHTRVVHIPQKERKGEKLQRRLLGAIFWNFGNRFHGSFFLYTWFLFCTRLSSFFLLFATTIRLIKIFQIFFISEPITYPHWLE